MANVCHGMSCHWHIDAVLPVIHIDFICWCSRGRCRKEDIMLAIISDTGIPSYGLMAYDAAGLCSQENGIQPAPCSHAETFSASVDSHLMTSYSRTTWVSQLSTRKVKPIRILMRLEMMGSSILSWTICKSFTPHSKHPCQHLITVFTGRMLFLMPNQRCQSAEKNGWCMVEVGLVSPHGVVPSRMVNVSAC